MRPFRTKTYRRIGIVLAVFCLLLCFTVLPGEAGPCERAFLRCTSDPMWINGLAAAVYCINGYLFCLKYIR